MKIFLHSLIYVFCFFGTTSYSLDVKWKIDGLAKPESAIYDRLTDSIYVSNIDGEALKLDKNGFISRISINGNIIEKNWVDGLDGPKGMAIYNNFLFVSDINKIWKISLKDKKMTYFKINDPGFLNDLAVDGKGNIYASDMSRNQIYILKNEKILIWKKLLFSPNGLIVDKDNLIVAQWGSITDKFETKTSGHLVKINLKTRDVKKFFSTRPIGNLDGIVFNKEKGFLVTDWINGKLFSVNELGIATLLKKLNKGSADLEIVMHKDLILIPQMLDNSLIAFSLN
ncbi:MAG: hypothetical protein CFH30_00357 [Alphaproteobacteria bacterium MarineAlpha8_Bin1]|nr:MAG: hypothetical protein CFH30_00357 [Alphaproteobacteria bacterium MarineAlpha8_Bin1]|tara:strand:+ start:160 stop:1011 length:852 start_codon:yes stop_codon:yes gene_type:complete